MIKQFPQINIEKKITKEGSYAKKIYLPKTFITAKKEIFLPKKENNFAETSLQKEKTKKNGYILEIIFHGLNYSAKRIKLKRKNFLIDVHKSEIMICNEPLTTLVKSRIYKRRLVFFSYDQQKIKYLEKYLKNFKFANSYTGKGIFSSLDNYKIKKTKKRK